MRTMLLLATLAAVTALALLLLPAQVSADGVPTLSVDGSSSREAIPGDQAIYALDVENTGDADEFDISLSYSNPDGNWTVYTSKDNLSIESGKSGRFYLNVLPHDNDTMPEDGQSLPVTVEVKARTGGASDSLATNTTCRHNVSYGVEYDSSFAAKTARPGYGAPFELGFTLYVTNTGTMTDDFGIEVNASYTNIDIRSWAEFGPKAQLRGLAPGSTGEVKLNITVPPHDEDHAATPGNKDFWVLVYSRGARDNNSEVVNETMDLFRARVDIKDYYYVDVDALDDHSATLHIGEPTYFDVRVKNLGNAWDEVQLVGDGTEGGKYTRWQSFDQNSVMLAPDSSVVVNMTILPDPEDKPEMGDYEFEYHAKSVNGTNVESDTESNRISIREFFDVEVKVNTDREETLPGEAVWFPIRLTNTGNSQTDIFLSPPTPTPADRYESWEFYWTADHGDDTLIPTMRNVDPDETVIAFIRAEPATNTAKALAGDYQIPFKVSTGSGDDEAEAMGVINLTVLQKVALTVTCSNPEDHIEPGERTSYIVELENTGNAWDNFTLKIYDPNKLEWISLDTDSLAVSDREDPEDPWPVTKGYNASRKEFVLGPQQILEVPFIVDIPLFTDEDDEATAKWLYDITVEFKSTEDNQIHEDQELKTTVDEVAGIQVTPRDGDKTVFLKNTGYTNVEFTLDVKNLGNDDDKFSFKERTLTGEMKDWVVSFEDEDDDTLPGSAISLDSLDTETVVVDIDIDDRTDADEYDFVFDVTSENDPDVKLTVTLEITTEKTVYGVKLEIDAHDQYDQEANPADMPSEGIEYKFNVVNSGQQPDSYRLTVDTNTGSGDYRDWEIVFDTVFGPATEMTVPEEAPSWQGSSFELEEGEDVEITVFVWPPEDETVVPKTDVMEITAESLQDTTKSDTIDFTLTIIMPDLVIETGDIWIDTFEAIGVGDTVDLDITIHNDGDAESGRFDVWVYKNKQYSLTGVGGTVGSNGLLIWQRSVESIDPKSDRVLSLDWEIEWGEHELYVYVDKPVSVGGSVTADRDRGDVIEEYENNNDAVISHAFKELLDLRPWIEVREYDFDKTPRAGETVTVTVTIYNNASHDSVASYGTSADDVDMYISCKAGGDFLKPKKGNGTPERGYRVAARMLPDDELEVEFEWKIEYEKGTNATIKAYIDYSENKNPKETRNITVEVKEADEDTSSSSFGGVDYQTAGCCSLSVLSLLVGFFIGCFLSSGRVLPPSPRKPGLDRPPGPFPQQRPPRSHPPPPRMPSPPELPEAHEIVPEEEVVGEVVSPPEPEESKTSPEAHEIVPEEEVLGEVVSSPEPEEPEPSPREPESEDSLPATWSCPKCGKRVGQSYTACFVCGAERP